MVECGMEQHWLERPQVWLPTITWSLEMSEGPQEHPWLAEHWTPEVQDITICQGLTQVPPLPQGK
jgi:hypothetical protein